MYVPDENYTDLLYRGTFENNLLKDARAREQN